MIDRSCSNSFVRVSSIHEAPQPSARSLLFDVTAARAAMWGWHRPKYGPDGGCSSLPVGPRPLPPGLQRILDSSAPLQSSPYVPLGAPTSSPSSSSGPSPSVPPTCSPSFSSRPPLPPCRPPTLLRPTQPLSTSQPPKTNGFRGPCPKVVPRAVCIKFILGSCAPARLCRSRASLTRKGRDPLRSPPRTGEVTRRSLVHRDNNWRCLAVRIGWL